MHSGAVHDCLHLEINRLPPLIGIAVAERVRESLNDDIAGILGKVSGGVGLEIRRVVDLSDRLVSAL